MQVVSAFDSNQTSEGREQSLALCLQQEHGNWSDSFSGTRQWEWGSAVVADNSLEVSVVQNALIEEIHELLNVTYFISSSRNWKSHLYREKTGTLWLWVNLNSCKKRLCMLPSILPVLNRLPCSLDFFLPLYLLWGKRQQYEDVHFWVHRSEQWRWGNCLLLVSSVKYSRRTDASCL